MLGRLLNTGIYPEFSFQQKNKLRVFNTACMLVLFICSIYLVYGIVSRFYIAACVSVFFISSILVSMCLVRARKHATAFHISMICGFIFVTSFSVLFGAESKSYYYFLFMPVAGTLLFDNKKIIVAYVAASVICLVGNVAFTEYLCSYYNLNGMWYFGYPNLIFTILLIFMGLRVFKLENQVYARQIEEQKHSLQEKNKEMTDSINYAQRIQYTLLAQEDLLTANLPEHFVYFKPKDIVSGDFYWAAKKQDCFYLAVCDSTGHGVPGAFMSLLNISFLNEALNEQNINSPDEILNHVRKRLIETISMNGAKDGMDAALICYDQKKKCLTYSAANNAPLLVRDQQAIVFKKDKMPVGKGEKHDPFVLHSFSLEAGDTLYLFTDGYTDQFGGPSGKKYKWKQLEHLLSQEGNKSLPAIKNKIDQSFLNWKGDLEQVDDICIIGIRFP